METKHDVKHIK
ncbi:predicted protein [Fibroporia radiculosa]|uniref:Uncharacterized protein n=1 Tax=Fibroporia radiculosa TaxID=599839 RepID=J7RI22_9APHY|nr:predicted protein [Fibroporia radiculosa]